MNPKLIADGRTQVMGAIVIALLSSLWANLANVEKRMHWRPRVPFLSTNVINLRVFVIANEVKQSI